MIGLMLALINVPVMLMDCLTTWNVDLGALDMSALTMINTRLLLFQAMISVFISPALELGKTRYMISAMKSDAGSPTDLFARTQPRLLLRVGTRAAVEVPADVRLDDTAHDHRGAGRRNAAIGRRRRGAGDGDNRRRAGADGDGIAAAGVLASVLPLVRQSPDGRDGVAPAQYGGHARPYERAVSAVADDAAVHADTHTAQRRVAGVRCGQQPFRYSYGAVLDTAGRGVLSDVGGGYGRILPARQGADSQAPRRKGRQLALRPGRGRR